MAAELPILTSGSRHIDGALQWWSRQEVMNPLAQVIVCGGPLLVGAIFPIGVPLYSTLFGPLGAYNCLFQTITGRPCPACGLTSGVVAAMHGNPALSWTYHPLGVMFVVVLALATLGGLLKLYALRRPLPQRQWVAWLVAFPPAALFGWIALAFTALFLGRLSSGNLP